MSRTLQILRRTLALLLCMLFLPLLTPTLAATRKNLTVSFSATTYQNRARSALKKINALRGQNGLQELVMTQDLEKAAIQRAAELFVFFDHDRPDLSAYDTVDDEYDAINAPMAVAECIAAGYSNADELMADWGENALDTLLDGDFTHAGLACVYIKGSYNEYYWALYVQQQPQGFSAKEAASTAKAGKKQSVTVEIDSGMFKRADNSHKRFELRMNNINMKTKRSVETTVYLYDRYDVKIGKCGTEALSFKSSNTGVVTVQASGTVRRKKAGTATLTVSADGLSDAKCTVTTSGGGTASTSGTSNATAVTADTIGGRKPLLSVTAYSKHNNLSVYVKGASGYVLYRAASRNGSYTKVDEKATTKRWTLKIEHDELSKTYYYKVRAYKNASGKRVYSEYSTAVKVAP